MRVRVASRSSGASRSPGEMNTQDARPRYRAGSRTVGVWCCVSRVASSYSLACVVCVRSVVRDDEEQQSGMRTRQRPRGWMSFDHLDSAGRRAHSHSETHPTTATRFTFRCHVLLLHLEACRCRRNLTPVSSKTIHIFVSLSSLPTSLATSPSPSPSTSPSMTSILE